ncbi:MAG: TetR/AcrR family transcriptional regulator C-terminal domain-containing protein [Ancalomicrobiaceae bacterium]|nr:TetR/AcrR family transcriptional regulator C-terminal domain-containing protein [Ancalomicrobiaceae bacterium]
MSLESDNRRREILEAAGNEFVEKGFAAATTAAIAARARASKRDIYRLFGSKEGILEALISTRTEPMAVFRPLSPNADLVEFLDALADFGRRFLPDYLEGPKTALYRSAIAEAPRSTRLSEAVMAKGAAPVQAAFIAFMMDAVRAGIVPADDAELVAHSFIDVLIGGWQLRLLLGTHPPPDAAAVEVQVSRAIEVVRRLIAAAPRDPGVRG